MKKNLSVLVLFALVFCGTAVMAEGNNESAFSGIDGVSSDIGYAATYMPDDQSVLLAQGGLVPCGWGSGGSFVECEPCHLEILAKRFVDFLVIATALVATLLFINAGILYLFSAGNPGNVAKAHRLFMNALVGFVIVLAAWLVVSLIMSWVYTGSPLEGLGGDWNEIICG